MQWNRSHLHARSVHGVPTWQALPNPRLGLAVMMVTKKLDIVYAHVDHSSPKDNELHSQIRDLLSQYGQVHGVVAHEVETLIRADVLVIETTIPDVLTVFLAGRAFEIGIRVLQLSKPALGPRCPGTIPGSTHYVYSSAGDLRRIIDGYFQL